jgi:hypothetical protein
MTDVSRDQYQCIGDGDRGNLKIRQWEWLTRTFQFNSEGSTDKRCIDIELDDTHLWKQKLFQVVQMMVDFRTLVRSVVTPAAGRRSIQLQSQDGSIDLDLRIPAPLPLLRVA